MNEPTEALPLTAEAELRGQLAVERSSNDRLRADLVLVQNAMSELRLKLLDHFAMHAPPPPHWYLAAGKDTERVFSWPYHFAKNVLERRPNK